MVEAIEEVMRTLPSPRAAHVAQQQLGEMHRGGDIHTAAQHIFVSADAWKRYAQPRLGIDQPTFMI